jgi:hypothetical protein
VYARNITANMTNEGVTYRNYNAFPVGTGTSLVANSGLAGVERITKTSSLREHKENIIDMPEGLSIIEKLRPRIFNWKQGEIDPNTEQPWTPEARAIQQLAPKSYGLIVEEVYEVMPELVFLSQPDVTKPIDEEGGFFDLNSWKPTMWKEIEVVSILVKAVQELSAKVQELESKLS